MKQKIALWQMAGFIFTAIAGTLLHFLFDFNGGSLPAALVSAVNESIWEHMKLIYVPMVLFALFQRKRMGKTETFWCVKLRGISLALVLIPALYYTYTGALGVSADWFNIAIFFLAAAAAYRLEAGPLLREEENSREGLCLLLVLLIGVAFLVFTFAPPNIPLFRDPVTGTYGFR